MTTEQQIRQDNPTTTTDSGERVGAGDPFYEAKIAEWVANYVASNQPSMEQQLADARAGMSSLLSSLPVESRAKFADARAGVEKLLDLGDIEAAAYRLSTIVADTPEEIAVKNILMEAINKFIPTQ
jgi:hypothetical protein